MLMNLPIIWACVIAFRRSSSRLRPELFAAGVLLGAAFLLKQPAAIATVPLGIYLLLPSYRVSRSLTRMNSIIQAAMLTTGFFLALGLVAIVLWKQGILHDAFYWTIADHDVPHVFWQKGIVITLTFLGVCLPLAIGAIMACRDKSEIWAGRTPERTALFGLLMASAIGAAAGARFYPYGLCLRRTDHRFGYSQSDLARCLDQSRARFCQASADLHCRYSIRQNCAVSSEELSNSRQTFGGTIPSSGAHRRRCDLSDALGLTSYSKR